MTHFTVGIIVPEDTLPQLQSFIHDQMQPYDESIRVAPYVSYTIEKAKAEIERDIARLGRILERQDSEYNLDKCREILAELRTKTPEDRYREYAQFHEHFNAKGEPLSTYNPNSKWDWWVIGGRWDGRINGKEDVGSEAVENNIATTGQAIERSIIPHAIITPNGQWHERGQMGWWAIMITENEQWNAQANEILSGYPDCKLVILDAHI